MDPYSTKWKTYLPSKKMVAVAALAVIVIAAIVLVPRIMNWIAVKNTVPANQSALVVTAPVGNPVERDSDRDGVMDWQEVAAGLDPDAPETSAGMPDALAYETQLEALPAEDRIAFKASGDTDKISYTIFDAIVAQANQTGDLNDASISITAQQELLNYFKGLAPAEVYTATNVKSVPSSPEADKAYKEAVARVGAIDLFSSSFQAQMERYITTGDNRQAVDAKVAELKKKIPQIAAIPVPSTIHEYQIASLNAMDGLVKLLDTYDPLDPDPLYQFANQTLIKMYEWAMIKNSISIMAAYGDPTAQQREAIIKSTDTL